MGLKSIKVLGISMTTDSKKTILEYIEKYLEQNSKFKIQNSKFKAKPLIIVTPNPEQIVAAQQDKHFAQILNQADVAIPDGIGLALAMRLLNDSSVKRQASSVKRRIPGVELMEDLVEMAAKEGYSIGLIGGRGGVAVEALECLQRLWPGLRGWTSEPGEISISDLGDLRYLGEKIQKTNTRLVFVGLGAPKQEYVIEELVRYSFLVHRKTGTVHNDQRTNKLTNHALVLMSVGGSFDINAGKTPRAPRAIQSIGLEWLWRLTVEPWRWRRQVALLRFLWLAVIEVIFHT